VPNPSVTIRYCCIAVRQVYSWLRHNTPDDARVMAWWDYGYQITAMANRTTLVDHLADNPTHIARVAKAFTAPEAVRTKFLCS
jgi:dolichyl-diphosphooligosaccharide--protein glycosyltransferase